MTPEEIEALKAEHEKIKKENEELKLKANPKDPVKDDPNKDKDKDFYNKYKDQEEINNKKQNDSKQVESAVRFDYALDSFVKDNEDILPTDMQKIVETAKKERFDSVIDKSNAIKSSFIQAFYSVQANMDLLTGTQRSAIEDFLKLTKNGKEGKASEIYENVFEPNVELIRRLKKAEELAKAKYGGFGTHTRSENEYINKLKDISEKHHLKK